MKKKVSTEITYAGKTITLPDDPQKMALIDAIDCLQRQFDADTQDYSIAEWITEGHPHDAAVAFGKAVKALYGFASFESQRSWFGDNPPKMLTVDVSTTEKVQVPFGAFRLPGMERKLETGIHENGENNALTFVIHGTVQRKDKEVILKLAEETRRILKEDSIYRGKAVEVQTDGYRLKANVPPKFMDVSDVSEASIIFDAETEALVRINILTPIKHTSEVVKYGIPLERGILLEGPFGTGKSLTAKVVARTCQDNGWTFILLDDVSGLNAALAFAKRYSPAVVFAEDIDRVLAERTDEANNLINTISGVGNNRDGIMIILTTNFIGKIDPVILRPGRLDAVISLRPPKASTVEKLLWLYGGGLISPDANLADCSKELEGQIPAVIREAIERSKLSMISRGDTSVTGGDILVAAQTMRSHMELLKPKDQKLTSSQMLANGLKKVVGEVVSDTLKSDLDQVIAYCS